VPEVLAVEGEQIGVTGRRILGARTPTIRHVGAAELEISPCSTHLAVQPRGITCTTIRRRQIEQYRGGSSASARWQRAWSPSTAAAPQRPHQREALVIPATSLQSGACCPETTE